MKHVILKQCALECLSLCCMAFLFACDNGNVAGGVTDIGNSIAGVVTDTSGTPVEHARVVAYIDDWELLGIKDSVETYSKQDGSYILNIQNNEAYVLLASLNEASGLQKISGDTVNIQISNKIALKGTLSEITTGNIRLLGSNLQTNVKSDGSFAFDSIPPGYIELSYINDDSSQAHFAFETDRKKNKYELPELQKVSVNTEWLTLKNALDYEKALQNGITIFNIKTSYLNVQEGNADSSETSLNTNVLIDVPSIEETVYGFTLPVKITTKNLSKSNLIVLDENKKRLPFEIEMWNDSIAWLWVQTDSIVKGTSQISLSFTDSCNCKSKVLANENVIAVLHLNGTETVYDNDSTIATSINYVDGIFGNAIELSEGQFIDLDTLNPTSGDFTLSLWTKWNGKNNHHQILFSQRAYWSDSTSRFQWHFEGNVEEFTVMKSMPGYPEAIFFGDKEIVPTDSWVLLSLVSKYNMVSMYVNGEQVGISQEFIPNDLSQAVPFRIGGNEINSETWNGVIDEIRIESVARDAQWLKLYYNIGASFVNGK